MRGFFLGVRPSFLGRCQRYRLFLWPVHIWYVWQSISFFANQIINTISIVRFEQVCKEKPSKSRRIDELLYQRIAISSVERYKKREVSLAIG